MTTWTERVPGQTRVPREFDPSGPAVPPNEKEKMENVYEDVELGYYSDPCIIVDMYGRIVTWYLPGILHPERMVIRTFLSPGFKANHLLDNVQSGYMRPKSAAY